MTELTDDTRTTQVFRVYITAPAEKIWDAITTPEWTAKYGYRGPATYELHAGGRFVVNATEQMKTFGAPDVVIDGEVLESDPPRKLVHTYRFNFAPEQTAEGFTTVTWELAPERDGITRLTVTHDVTGAPQAAAMIAVDADVSLEQGGGGWAWILSDLKTLLESDAARTP